MVSVQGYLAHKKPTPHRTLQQGYARGPMVVLDGWAFSYEPGTLEGGAIDRESGLFGVLRCSTWFHDFPRGANRIWERICETDLRVESQKRYQIFLTPLGTCSTCSQISRFGGPELRDRGFFSSCSEERLENLDPDS